MIGTVLFAPASLTASERRFALVIGNDFYENIEPLKKAVNDARTISRTLQEKGFVVSATENVGRREFNRSLQNFISNLEPGDVAFFFYAGHGVAIDGRNFLLPSDIPEARPGQGQFVRSEAIAVDEILAAITGTGARISVLVIDACRDNPFARHGTRGIGRARGLTRVAPPAGSFVLYSAGVGQSALDELHDGDVNPNSVFTRSLVPRMSEPGLTLPEIARRVRRDVQSLAATVSHEQRPAYYDEVVGDFFVAGAPASIADSESNSGQAVSNRGVSGVAEVWAATKDSKSIAVLRSFADSFPGSIYATMAEARITELEREVHASLPQPSEQQPGSIIQTVPSAARQLHFVTGLNPDGDNWLALRATASTSGTLLARMAPETAVDVVGRSGAWLSVVVENGPHRGQRGWAYSKYIACCRAATTPASPTASRPEAVATHFVTGLNPKGDNWLALRTRPGGSGRRIAKMGPQTQLRVLSRSGSWFEVTVQNTDLRGSRGWAHSRYIECCLEVPVR